MSKPEASGIVFYPRFPEPSSNEVDRRVPPNIARQLGMVTNARFGADDEVVLGSVHAVPYDPEIAYELNQLKDPKRRTQSFPLPENVTREQKSIALVDLLNAAAYEYLGEQGLARGGQARTLSNRRVDVIAPIAVDDSGRYIGLADALMTMREPFRGEPPDWLNGTVWSPVLGRKGLYTEQLPSANRNRSFDPDHPLIVTHGMSSTTQDHRIHTTRATHSLEVAEDITVVTDSIPDQAEAYPRSTYRQVGRTTLHRYGAIYEVPVDLETAATIGLLRQSMDWSAEAAREAADPDLWDYNDSTTPEVAGYDVLKYHLRPITDNLDPLNDLFWQSRLT